MEKIIINYSPDIEQYLNNLIDVLFAKEYFGFKENAIKYVLNITTDIEINIHLKKHQTTPLDLIKFGKNYISYKANNKTSWYIFFDKKDNRYLVKYITNNHVAKTQFLNKL